MCDTYVMLARTSSTLSPHEVDKSAAQKCTELPSCGRDDGDTDLCLIREDSGLMMIQNKGGNPRQDGRAPSAALIKHY